MGKHCMGADKMHGEKTRCELYMNTSCSFEEILEATLHKKAAIWPLTSDLTNHPSKMIKTCRATTSS